MQSCPFKQDFQALYRAREKKIKFVTMTSKGKRSRTLKVNLGEKCDWFELYASILHRVSKGWKLNGGKPFHGGETSVFLNVTLTLIEYLDCESEIRTLKQPYKKGRD